MSLQAVSKDSRFFVPVQQRKAPAFGLSKLHLFKYFFYKVSMSYTLSMLRIQDWYFNDKSQQDVADTRTRYF